MFNSCPNNVYNVELPEGIQYATLSAKAKHEKARIEAPEKIKAGETAEIKVIAEDGSYSMFYVNVIMPENMYTALSKLKYKTNNDIYDVKNFDKNKLKKEYFIEVMENVKDVTVIAVPDDENIQISYNPSDSVNLAPGEIREIIIEAKLPSGIKEKYSVKIFRKLYTDIEGTEDGGEI